MWVADPDNGVKSRPAIIWLHGGGFAVGIDSMHALAEGTAKEYAQRGYVGFSVEYRTDTTLKGEAGASGRPPSLCQWVQDNEDPTDPEWVAAYEQCKGNIIAAQRDVQGAVRYIRKNADKFGIDPNKIAVGGFSAGAVTALNLAYRSEDVGDNRYFSGDDLSVSKSKIQGALAASGCYRTPEEGTTEIGSGDAPASQIASKFDGAVPYECVAEGAVTARRAGLVAELTSYCNESTHAAALYRKYKAATDEQWTTFLARQLKLYTGMREPTAKPVCR
ncbi:MAG: alpha/beta hydrolase [Acidimicrobiia bacterium]|nr:alpha/beta hydrolase [Acidimicrobiia bacterium]